MRILKYILAPLWFFVVCIAFLEYRVMIRSMARKIADEHGSECEALYLRDVSLSFRYFVRAAWQSR